MIRYGPGLVFPDAWGGRPEEALGCGCALNDGEMFRGDVCDCCREREDDR